MARIPERLGKCLDDRARDVASRNARSLEPIAAQDVPREITPLVSSINGLMVQLSAALSAQRRFLADAAHELRTPVTAPLGPRFTGAAD